MKQRLLIFGGFILLILVMIGLNAASFSRQNKIPDNEYQPNRSTFNSDLTGTRAIYDLLAETGRKVTRWQEKPSALLSNSANRPSVFVIIGETRREVTDTEAVAIMRWVSEGGRLVIIDREPMTELVKTTAQWQISTDFSESDSLPANPTDINLLTNQSESLKPLQPTPYTRSVNAIKPSVLASKIKFQYVGNDNVKTAPMPVDQADADEYDFEDDAPPPVANPERTPAPTPKPLKIDPAKNREADERNYEQPPDMFPTPAPPAPRGKDSGSGIGASENVRSKLAAPVIHFANGDDVVLADFPFGSGEVVYLSDPFIVANNGLKFADNSQLAINLLSSENGITAFDEFHQGYGKNDDRLAAYFEGTPVLAILAQIGVFFGLLFWSRGRRFARALPLGDPDRLSKLEYVTAMAEIQENIKAYDLAIENIFNEFRRNLIRFTGDDNTVSNENLAAAVADRTDINRIELLSLMNDCQSIHYGEATNKSEVLKLATRIREIENEIGIKRAARRKL